jgi:hypothetical protein
MSAKGMETKYVKNSVPDEERCLFTTNHGNRCRNAHLGNASGHCAIHEEVPKGRDQKEIEAEARAVAAQLLANDVELRTKDDVNRFTSQLFTMVAEKKVSRQDGSLLAYIASVLLQTIAPEKAEAVVEQREEFVESAAAPIRQERIQFPRHNVGVAGVEPTEMPGRSNNPYMHPGKKWR